MYHQGVQHVDRDVKYVYIWINIYVYGVAMFSKLTLRLKIDDIENAKRWAERNNTSLSQLVSMLFRFLGNKEKTGMELTPWTKKLMGAAKAKGKKAPTDKIVKNAYVDYLEEKYK